VQYGTSNTKKRAFSEICPRKNLPFQLTTGHRPLTTAPNPHRQKRPQKNTIFSEKTTNRIFPEPKTPRNPEDSTMDVMEQFAIPEHFKLFPAQTFPIQEIFPFPILTTISQVR
jgi:hypothetical protein